MASQCQLTALAPCLVSCHLLLLLVLLLLPMGLVQVGLLDNQCHSTCMD
jgi:hypothetical protein